MALDSLTNRILLGSPSGTRPAPALANSNATPRPGRDAYLPSALRPPTLVANTSDMRAELLNLRQRLAAISTALDLMNASFSQASQAMPEENDFISHGPADDLLNQPSLATSGMAAMPAMDADPKDVASLTQMFNMADTNHDGFVNFGEMVAHENGDVAKAKLHFADADRKGDGKVDLAEWIWHHQNSPLHNPGAQPARVTGPTAAPLSVPASAPMQPMASM
jgi:hypothetical protein